MLNNRQKKLGDILVEMKLITPIEHEEALAIQRSTGQKYGAVLVKQNLVTEAQIIQALEMQLGIPHLNLDTYFIDPEVPKLIAENLAKKHTLIPINRSKSKIIVAMADPLNILAIDDVRLATGLEVSPVIATAKDVESAIERYYGQQSAEKAVEDFAKQYELEHIEITDFDFENDVNNAPIVRLVNSIFRQAVKLNASDIHIEPCEDSVRIRFRVDGDLREAMTTAKATHSGIVTRIKIVGKLDIAERRLPQDGRLETIIENRNIDMRISVLPTVFGEKVVIRLLDNSSFNIDKDNLGLSPQNLLLLDKMIKSPNGIILVTGPTGSGKSTTLYSILRELDSVSKNIITIEDPVEFRIEKFSQVQVNYKTGMDFATGLRAILRQDPDIIMIGEIRDNETAQIAVRAAVTGHLVLSTMHTNDTSSTITRFFDMEVPSYLVASAIVGVIAQRLVKKICPKCRVEYEPSEDEVDFLGVGSVKKLYRGSGCNFCENTGYQGRVAVHEIMHVNREIRSLASSTVELDRIRDAAKKNGMISLRDSTADLVVQGQTTYDELIRIAFDAD